MDLEHRIRERAYAIWEAEGCVAGCEHDHWSRAERELRAGAQAPAMSAAKVAKSSAAARSKKSAAAAGAIAKGKRPGAKVQVLHS
jgi:hypothetical protein